VNRILRKMPEYALIALSRLSVCLMLGVIAVFLGYLIERGAGVLGTRLIFGNVPVLDALAGRMPVWNGIWPALAGTGLLVLLSSSMAIPLGVASGIYFAEYAGGRTKTLFGFAVDVLSGTPSIIMGLFGFAFILFLRKTFVPTANVCLLLSAGCLALLVLPAMIRTTQVAFETLPEMVRLVGPSLGFSRWQNVRHVLLPASSKALFAGIILSIGRAAEDTAVILLTGVVANAGLPGALTDKFEALPFTIFFLGSEYRSPEELDRGFGSALLLLLLTAAIFATAMLLRRAFQTESR
jgi:phosphate transport system permease protein